MHPGKPGVEPSPHELKPLGRSWIMLGNERTNLLAESVRVNSTAVHTAVCGTDSFI